jgi:hypothetical protein
MHVLRDFFRNITLDFDDCVPRIAMYRYVGQTLLDHPIDRDTDLSVDA